VGDAGYYKDPIGSHGITDALRDAELAAGALLDGLSDSGSEVAALTGYHRLRDEMSRDLLAVTDAVASYAWDATEVQLLLRRLSTAMAPEVELLESLPHAGKQALPVGAP
jgi:2-polyprenyl-6-methoxyphenol hydroxylase-like FAD-dependent oxidoreductase